MYELSRIVTIEDFLNNDREFPIVDVRAPVEYDKGHIPGAVNIPLFSNKERTDVGICYKHKGKDAAVELGLEIVGPKLSDFVKQCKELSPTLEIKVYCARGGMRSGSFCWLLETAGFKTVLRLEKGYKAYRNLVVNFFEGDYTLKVLSGMTGSGKTDILLEMEKLGLQVIDLEGFANHRGSAFGAVGKIPETSNEKFENNIYAKIMTFDKNKPIWVEDESRNVGRVLIPPPFFKTMERSQRYVVELSREIRAERLAKDYTGYGNETLLESLSIIKRRLSERYPLIVDHINNGEYKEAAILILPYYDKSYKNGIGRRDPEITSWLDISEDNPEKTAKYIKEITNG